MQFCPRANFGHWGSGGEVAGGVSFRSRTSGFDPARYAAFEKSDFLAVCFL